MMKTVITGTGAYIPEWIRSNKDFSNHLFFHEDGLPMTTAPAVLLEKFQKITGIYERRYIPIGLKTSDMAVDAAVQAIKESGIDAEKLDQVIVAHNFGDILSLDKHSQNVPSLASKVKHKLAIKNPGCIAYDILFGCPGWIQALIQTEAYFKAGMAKKALIIGAETLSRVIDPADRDSMIFADGAGACVLEFLDTGDDGSGIIGSSFRTDTITEVEYITMGASYDRCNDAGLYMKMKGRKVYEYALTNVPLAIKSCLDQCRISILEVKKIFIHQANEKMDEEIVKRLFGLYGYATPPKDSMPMNIQWLGNSSVATVPTLYHMVRNEIIKGHEVGKGDIVVFASVGAGMSINAICYRV